MSKRFLFVTANQNETDALLSDKEFFNYTSRKSEDPVDITTYNVGKFGQHEVIHFELQSQGSVKSDASILSVDTAIREFAPDAVILLGIAFGKHDDQTEEPRQHIGDVLVSTMIADYESGKLKKNSLEQDGARPESGRVLLSAFRAGHRSWNHTCNGQKAKVYFGLLLSGDKVVDDKDFKNTLFECFPRAIGGEMEGRGAYSACRRHTLNEWIVVKSICDWADGTKSVEKEQRQKDAAKSVVSLLKHIFSKDSFEKLPERKAVYENIITKKQDSKDEKGDITLGYFINIGMTSCRLFQVLNLKKLREVARVTYTVNDPKSEEYLPGIINHIKNELLPNVSESLSSKLIRVFVDYNFRSVFDSDVRVKDFIRDFYKETNLYFNILSKNQTKANLKKLFGDTEDTAIINIGSHCVDVYVLCRHSIDLFEVKVSLKDIENYIKDNEIEEKWNNSNIKSIKSFIKEKLNSDIQAIRASTLVILKDELSFMKERGYPLQTQGNDKVLDVDEYKRANRKCLFKVDYETVLRNSNLPEKEFNRLYNFKYGHIIIETLADLFEVKTIKPSDEMSIHGSRNALNAYIFNIVISGSTHNGRDKYMLEAHDRFIEMGASVLSPRLSDGKLAPISDDSEYEHLRAIDLCDVLFICNKDGESCSIGESTKCEIYYAYALRKTIIFWKKPTQDRLAFIPNEQWDSIDF